MRDSNVSHYQPQRGIKRGDVKKGENAVHLLSKMIFILFFNAVRVYTGLYSNHQALGEKKNFSVLDTT